MLKKMEEAIKTHAFSICDALQQDLGKPPFESRASEIAVITAECRLIRRKLRKWSKPKRVRGNLMLFGSVSRIHREPLGQVLILSPWNYPLELLFSPLIGALAAGNTVILKPSPAAPQTVAIMKQICEEVFPEELVKLIEGDASVMDSLLEMPFNHIFVTGSTALGRHVMKKTAERLIPVTLELGGKSPCIVDRNVDLQRAARRIAWGKFLNAGQTCIAPDYLLVHHEIMEPLIKQLAAILEKNYLSPSGRESYGKIISPEHTERLAELLKYGRVRSGGEYDTVKRFFAPTILDKVKLESPLMTEEIFGPLLPVIPWSNLNEAVRFINRRPQPLALYCFGRNKKRMKKILEQTSAGGGCINDTILHVANPRLPFGGVGDSGQGRYHGKASFLTFSNTRSVLTRHNRIDPKDRFPPYTAKKFKRLRRFFR